MDHLSKFMIELCGTPTEKTAAQQIEIVEPSEYEKRAYMKAIGDCGMDSDFLTQFEGTPLYPQAIALAEQELATEQRHLQARMARAAQRQTDNWDQECNETEGLRLQKAQLLLQMHKMKAMGQGAPTPPGQAVIGEPQPGVEAMGMGPEGGAPVEEPMGGAGGPAKIAAIRKLAQQLRTKANEDEDEDPPFPIHPDFERLRLGQKAAPALGALAGMGAGMVGGGLGGLALTTPVGNMIGKHVTNPHVAIPLGALAGGLLAAGGTLGGAYLGAHGGHALTRGFMSPENIAAHDAQRRLEREFVENEGKGKQASLSELIRRNA